MFLAFVACCFLVVSRLTFIDIAVNVVSIHKHSISRAIIGVTKLLKETSVIIKNIVPSIAKLFIEHYYFFCLYKISQKKKKNAMVFFFSRLFCDNDQSSLSSIQRYFYVEDKKYWTPKYRQKIMGRKWKQWTNSTIHWDLLFFSSFRQIMSHSMVLYLP